MPSKPKTLHPQAGVTLLLTILVLAAITAIAFSLAAIILVEIRSSGDVMRTEPALYAVQGITEEAFFKYSRDVPDSLLNIATGDTDTDTTGCVQTNVCGTNGQSTFNGVSLSPLPQVKVYDPLPRIDTIAAGTSVNYLFINPRLPGDFNTKVYNSFSFKALNSVSNASALITKCCDAAGAGINVQSYSTLPVNLNNTYSISDNKQYLLTITNANSSTPLLVEMDAVKATAVNGQTHLMPLIGKVLDVDASYLGLSRRYSISLIQNLGFSPSQPTNVALGTNGALASASSSFSGYAASGAINGDRKGLNGGSNGYWSTAAPGFPAWLEVNFGSSRTITEVDVFTVQDNYTNPIEPTMTTTFTSYGLTGYRVQYWNGGSWSDIPGASVTGNNLIWRQFSFSAITTSRIRVLTGASPDSWSRLTEVEAWGN